MKRRTFLTVLGFMPVIATMPALALSAPHQPVSNVVDRGDGERGATKPTLANDHSFVVMGDVYRNNTCIKSKNSKFTICNAIAGIELHR